MHLQCFLHWYYWHWSEVRSGYFSNVQSQSHTKPSLRLMLLETKTNNSLRLVKLISCKIQKYNQTVEPESAEGLDEGFQS